MSSTIKASVIIPTYNGADKVYGLLQQLQAQQQISSDTECIVIVDGSVDGTYEKLTGATWNIPNLRVVNQENKGRAGARNAGAAQARGAVLIFFDDDIIPTPGLVQGHLQCHETQDVVVGFLESGEGAKNNEMLLFSDYLNKRWSSTIGTDTGRPYITAANFSIKKSVFERYNGFDNRLNDSEDLELAIRLQKDSITIFNASNLVAGIPLNDTFAQTFRRIKEYKKGREKLVSVSSAARNMVGKPGATISPAKKAFFYFFSFPFLVKLADKNFFTFLPEKWRFKVYDWMMTANMIY